MYAMPYEETDILSRVLCYISRFICMLHVSGKITKIIQCCGRGVLKQTNVRHSFVSSIYFYQQKCYNRIAVVRIFLLCLVLLNAILVLITRHINHQKWYIFGHNSFIIQFQLVSKRRQLIITVHTTMEKAKEHTMIILLLFTKSFTHIAHICILYNKRNENDFCKDI